MQQQPGQQAEPHAGRVVIGMDPHKRSATIEVVTADETILGTGRFGTDEAGFTAMRRLRQGDPARGRGPGVGGRGLQGDRSPHRIQAAC
jgi:hypothetical protein